VRRGGFLSEAVIPFSLDVRPWRSVLAWCLVLAPTLAACAGKTTESSPDGGSSGGSSAGGTASGGAGTGSTAAGGTGGAGTEATIMLTNGSNATVWVQTAGGCAQIPAWFAIRQGGSELSVVGHCVTDCATYDPDKGPLGCPAICLADAYEPIAPGASIEFAWDGASWVSDPRGCSNRAPVTPGTTLDVEFCAIDGSFEPDEFSVGAGPDPDLVYCKTVTVLHGASDTVAHVFEGP
jgi:hypothetical protein